MIKLANIIIIILFFNTVLYSQNILDDLCIFNNNEILTNIDSIIEYEKNCDYFNDTSDCFIIYDILTYSQINQCIKNDTLLVISTINKNSINDTVEICYYRDFMFVFDLNSIENSFIVKNNKSIVFKKTELNDELFIIDDSRDIWVFNLIDGVLIFSFKSGSCVK